MVNMATTNRNDPEVQKQLAARMARSASIDKVLADRDAVRRREEEAIQESGVAARPALRRLLNQAMGLAPDPEIAFLAGSRSREDRARAAPPAPPPPPSPPKPTEPSAEEKARAAAKEERER